MHEYPRVLLTGATGFVGAHILNELIKKRMMVRVAVRRKSTISALPVGVDVVELSDVGPDTIWDEALQNVDVVLHVAGLAARGDDAALYRVNVEGTAHLARCAAIKGVKRFVFMSSLKVNGEITVEGQVLNAHSPANPQDAYAKSKFHAEQALQDIAEDTGMALVVIRPPMVYGPGVKGNFFGLLKIVQKGIPLPLASVNNQRSLIAVQNLADFAVRTCWHPQAEGVFLVSDSEPISTPDLLTRLAQEMGKQPYLLNVSVVWIRILGRYLGVQGVLSKLIDSLVLDNQPAIEALNWSPPLTTSQGIRATVAWYQEAMC